MNLRNLDSTLLFFFSHFDFCFVLVLVSMFVVTHLSTSSSWQTEVQDKTLPAWSWHILCTVESLDLAAFDDHLSLAPVGRVEQPSGQREWKAPAQYCHLRLGWENSSLWALTPPHSSAPLPPVAWLSSSPPGWVSLGCLCWSNCARASAVTAS